MAPDPSQWLDPLAILKAAWPIFKPFAVVILAIAMIKTAFTLIKWTRFMRAGMPEIDRMTGRDFEGKVSFLLEGEGYRVQLTPYAGDWGADLILSREGRRTVAQLKRWSRKVGVTAIQEVVASKGKYRCENAMVITNSYFTKAARELARANAVELWDRDRLASELMRGKSVSAPGSSAPGTSAPDALAAPASASAPRAATAASAASPPKCARCGREMIRRRGKYGEFWGCSGFPRCRNTLPVTGQNPA